MNLVTLSGRLGSDPKTAELENGTVTSVSLATDESYSKKDGTKVQQTEWHDLEIWGRQGEVLAQYTKKGSKLLITGRIKTNKWQSKDGETKRRTIIVVNSFEFLDSASRSESDSEPTVDPRPANKPAQDEEDLPF
jgi:single-strand DNA-binding protein